MERCHGGDIHARTHVLQRPWSGAGFATYACSIQSTERREQMPRWELLLQSEQVVQELWVQQCRDCSFGLLQPRGACVFRDAPALKSPSR